MPTLITRTELKDLRHKGAASAASLLGFHESDTYFLDFQDGCLHEHVVAAEERVLQILDQQRPEVVFIPYAPEPLDLAVDHVMTTQIVNRALSRLERNLIVWEYPVCFWVHWPWVAIRQGNEAIIETRSVVGNSVRSLFGARAFFDLRHSVDTSDVLERKSAHSPNIDRRWNYFSRRRWLTLGQITGGEFLARFDHGREFFKPSEVFSNWNGWEP